MSYEDWIDMPAIKPVSDLRSYNEVLADVHEGSPVFLTKNGRGCYAVLDMRDYDRLSSMIGLLGELEAGRESGERDGWISEGAVDSHFKQRSCAHAAR